MKNFYYYSSVSLFLLICLLIISCGDNKPSQDSKENQTVQPKSTKNPYPSLTNEEYKSIYEKCDYMDLMLYNTNFSMSIDNKKGIQSFLSTFDAIPPEQLDLNCPAQGKVFFQVDGENELIADLYYTPGCTYFIFEKNKKKMYSNKMNQTGKDYLNNVFKQAGAPQFILK